MEPIHVKREVTLSRAGGLACTLDARSGSRRTLVERTEDSIMAHSKWLIGGGVGCLLVGTAGLLELFKGEIPLGLLLIGFSLSLFGNVRCLCKHATEQTLTT